MNLFCVFENGLGDLVRINGFLNTEKYRQILIHHAITLGSLMIGSKCILQKAKNPKYTAKVIINCVWDYVRRQRDVRKLTFTKDLWVSSQLTTNYLLSFFKNCVQL